jgi:site-specific DNA-cytosine methylase
MIIYDLFSGTGSASKPFEDAGHTVIRIELDESFQAHERNVLTLDGGQLVKKYGKPDFIWASPPCTAFSVASIGKHWNTDKTPKTQDAYMGWVLVQKTIDLIESIKPKHWVIENPRGMLRTLLIYGTRHTVSYCQYGDNRQKPTDLWTNITNWQPRPICKPKSDCHESAPRGSRTGTQGIKGAKLRSMIPYELGREILESIS